MVHFSITMSAYFIFILYHIFLYSYKINYLHYILFNLSAPCISSVTSATDLYDLTPFSKHQKQSVIFQLLQTLPCYAFPECFRYHLLSKHVLHQMNCYKPDYMPVTVPNSHPHIKRLLSIETI